MKLQINDSGSWRNVVTVDKRREYDLKLAAGNIGLMAHMAGSRLTMRLVDDFETVVAHWTADRDWAPMQRPAVVGAAS